MKYFTPPGTIAGIIFVLGAMFLLKADPACTEAIRLRDTETTRSRRERRVGTTDERRRRECFGE